MVSPTAVFSLSKMVIEWHPESPFSRIIRLKFGIRKCVGNLSLEEGCDYKSFEAY